MDAKAAIQIASMALTLFQMIQPVLQPYEQQGINALVNAINSHKAGGPEAKKLSFSDIHALAAQHNVNMNAVYTRVIASGAVSLFVVAKIIGAMRRSAKQ